MKLKAFTRMRFLAGVAATAGLLFCSPEGFAKELAHSDTVIPDVSDADKVGVTRYMSCRSFLDLIKADSDRANRSHSLDSNRVLERHTVQMMVLLQPYAVTGPDGHPLDFVWGYLVSTLGDWCADHPASPLDDGIHYAGMQMVDAVRHARENGLKDQSVVEKAHEPEAPSLPPASLFSPSLPGPEPVGP